MYGTTMVMFFVVVAVLWIVVVVGLVGWVGKLVMPLVEGPIWELALL